MEHYTLDELLAAVGMPKEAAKKYAVDLNAGNAPDDPDDPALYNEADRLYLADVWERDKDRYFQKKKLISQLNLPAKSYARMSTREYCETERWANLSYDCKERDLFRCRLCNKKGGINADGLPILGLQAHHRSYRYRGQDYQSELADLTCLCNRCHEIYEFIIKGRGDH